MLEQFMNTLAGLFGFGLAGALKAVLLVIVAFVLANWARQAVAVAAAKTSFFRDKGNSEGVVDFIGRLVYLAVLLLFVPGICSALGASSIADPVLDMLRKLWAFLPNVIGTGVILAIGYQIAKIVRQLSGHCLKKECVEKLLIKIGEDKENSPKVIEAVSYIVYIAVLVPVFIAALQVLDLASLTRPAVLMLQNILAFVPNLLAAVFILGIGFVLARLAGRLSETTVAAAGLDQKIRKFIGENDAFAVSSLVGRMVHMLVVVFFVVEALNALHMAVLAAIGKAIIGYLPDVCAAVVITLLAWMGAKASGRVLHNMRWGRCVAKCVIYALAAFMVLSQLHIAPYIVNTAFTLMFFSIAVAFSIAVGFGAKDVVRDTLQRKLAEPCKDNMEEKQD